MNKLIVKISTVLVAVALTATAYAGTSTSGKVTKVAEDQVTVTVDGTVPAWAKKGSTVSAFGGSPKVVDVNGNQVTLKMPKSKAAKIKVDSSVTVTEAAGDELQGC